MSQEKHELLTVIKELLELMTSELSVLNKRIENLEKEQILLRSLLASILERNNVETSVPSSFIGRFFNLFKRRKQISPHLKEYITFLKDNPDKVPISGCFKRSFPRREGTL